MSVWGDQDQATNRAIGHVVQVQGGAHDLARFSIVQINAGNRCQLARQAASDQQTQLNRRRVLRASDAQRRMGAERHADHPVAQWRFCWMGCSGFMPASSRHVVRHRAGRERAGRYRPHHRPAAPAFVHRSAGNPRHPASRRGGQPARQVDPLRGRHVDPWHLHPALEPDGTRPGSQPGRNRNRGQIQLRPSCAAAVRGHPDPAELYGSASRPHARSGASWMQLPTRNGSKQTSRGS